MSERRLTVLGSSSQFPTTKRNHNGHFLRWDREGLLFDPGEGTQRQFRHFRIAASGISRILISHFHGDHCLGLPGVIQRLNADGVAGPIPIYYPASGQEFLDRLRYASSFYETTQIVECPIDDSGIVFETKDLIVRAFKLDHSIDCYGYRIEEKEQRQFDKDKLDALGLNGPLVGELKRNGHIEIDETKISIEDVSYVRPGQRFAMVTDTAFCDAAIETAANADVLLAEATYLESEDRKATVKHMTVYETATIAREANVRNLLLTHFSERYQDLKEFISAATSVCPSDVKIVNDGHSYVLQRDGSVKETLVEEA